MSGAFVAWTSDVYLRAPVYCWTGVHCALCRYDPLQAKMSKIDANVHGKWLLDAINATVLQTRRADGMPNGGYLYSCSRHCGGELISIDGYTAPTALETFFRPSAAAGNGGHGPLFLQYKPDPCVDCCNDGAYHPPRQP